MKSNLNYLFDYPNLKVYQDDDSFKFSLDSILLAEFAKIKPKDNKIIDLCTGNAVIPIILNYKYNKEITGVEYQELIYNMAINSVKYNNLDNKIKIINDDVHNLTNYIEKHSVDVITSNPPYFKVNETSRTNLSETKCIARHEVKLNLEDLMKIVSDLLKNKGRFYLVHIPERIDEIIIKAKENKLALKRLQFIYSDFNKKPVMALMEFYKEGSFGVKVLPPINITGLKTYQKLFKESDKL